MIQVTMTTASGKTLSYTGSADEARRLIELFEKKGMTAARQEVLCITCSHVVECPVRARVPGWTCTTINRTRQPAQSP